MDYEINVKGKGSPRDIVKSLKELIATIEDTTKNFRLEIGSVEFEGGTLHTTIEEL